MTTPLNRFSPDRIPDYVLDKIVTRIEAELKEPRWCVCGQRPAIIGPWCAQCCPDDTDFEGE